MRFINASVYLTLLVLPLYAAEQLLPVKRSDGEVLRDSYVVLLKDGFNLAAVSESVSDMNITHQWSIINGFTATLSQERLDKLRAQPNVLSISENAAVRTSATQ